VIIAGKSVIDMGTVMRALGQASSESNFVICNWQLIFSHIVRHYTVTLTSALTPVLIDLKVPGECSLCVSAVSDWAILQ
jgi:hypothetical protein